MAKVFAFVHGKRAYLVEPGPVLIGRDLDCNVYFQDELLSRRHAMVARTEAGLLLVDLASSNGTFVNGTRVTEQYLFEGDEVGMGGQQFEVGRVSATTTVPVAVEASEPVPWRWRYEALERLRRMLEQGGAGRELLQRAAAWALDAFTAFRSHVVLSVEDGGSCVPAPVVVLGGYEDEFADGRHEGAVRMAARVVATGEGASSRDVLQDPRFAGVQQLFNARAAMCAPLRTAGRVVGALYVDRRISAPVFVGGQFETLCQATAELSLALELTDLSPLPPGERVAAFEAAYEALFPASPA